MKVKVRSRKAAGFRRAGMFHPPVWTEHDGLSKDTVKQLVAEPLLEVEVLPVQIAPMAAPQQPADEAPKQPKESKQPKEPKEPKASKQAKNSQRSKR